MILEDTDGDGKADSIKVFAQDKAIFCPLGICVMGNKVYVSQSPKMVVYTIDESGDKPVGPPEVLFSGFSGSSGMIPSTRSGSGALWGRLVACLRNFAPGLLAKQARYIFSGEPLIWPSPAFLAVRHLRIQAYKTAHVS